MDFVTMLKKMADARYKTAYDAARAALATCPLCVMYMHRDLYQDFISDDAESISTELGNWMGDFAGIDVCELEIDDPDREIIFSVACYGKNDKEILSVYSTDGNYHCHFNDDDYSVKTEDYTDFLYYCSNYNE